MRSPKRLDAQSVRNKNAIKSGRVRIMKVYYWLLSVTVLSAPGGEAGVYEGAVGAARGAGDCVRGWWAYGRSFISGDDRPAASGAPEPPAEWAGGAKPGVLGKIRSGIDTVRQSAYNILFGDEHDEKKGFLALLYDTTSKRISKLKRFLSASDGASTEVPRALAARRLDADAAAVRRVFDEALVSDQIKRIAGKFNIWNDILKLREEVSKAKTGFRSSDDDASPGAAGRAVLDDEFDRPGRDPGYYRFQDRDGTAVYKAGDQGFIRREKDSSSDSRVL